MHIVFRIAALIALVSFSACGGVIWTQDLLQSGNNWDMSGFVQAVDFTLTSAANVTDLRIWIADRAQSGVLDGVADSYSGTLGWAIYSDNAGAPGTLLFSGTDAATSVTATGLLSGTSREIFLVDAVLSGAPSLTASTYWLAVHEGSWGSASDSTSVGWMEANPAGAARYNSSDPQNPSFAAQPSGDAAFVLYDNSVPEPSSLALMSLGLAALAFRRLRKR
jgi:hypothetical protein